MSYTEEFKVVAATVYGEAGGQSVASQKAIANCIMNRVRYKEWKKFETAASVVTKTGFDAYSQQTVLYKRAYAEMSAGAITTSKLQALVDAIKPIIYGTEGDGCGNIVLYYSPKAQAALHKKNPKMYKEQPKWNFDALEQVQVAGTERDDFAWYRYKGTGARVRVVDQAQQPVKNLEYKITNKERKVIAQGKTDADGHHEVKIKEHVKHGDPVTLFIKNIRQEWQELRNFAFNSDAFSIALTSPKTKYSVALKQQSESGGGYVRGTYTVKKGDTLGSIAKRFHTNVDWLANRNKIHDVNSIKIGQALIVPPVEHRDGTQVPAPSSGNAHAGSAALETSTSIPKASAGSSKPEGSGVSKTTRANEADSSVKASPDRTDAAGSRASSGATAKAANQTLPIGGQAGSEKGGKAPVTATSPKPIPKPIVIADYSKDNGSPQTLVQAVRCENQSGCLKKGDRGRLVEELNIRLTGFGGTVPSDEFTSLTEAAVKQFQRDYMGVPPTGRVCGNTIVALDRFRVQTMGEIDRVFRQINCPCGDCSGFGTGAYQSDPYPRNMISDREEYPGIHRSLIWMMKSMYFYLEKEQELKYSFGAISSGYRCHENNKKHKRKTTNHMGKALDLVFKKNERQTKNKQEVQEIREKIFIKYLGARMGLGNLNQMGMESIQQGATTWVHVDVRQFEQKYKDHRFFVQSSATAHGEPLIEIARNNGRVSVLSCVGLN